MSKTMNKYNYITILAIVVFIAIAMGITIGYYKELKKKEVKEGFMPGIHQMYRPYLRRGRIYTNNLTNYMNTRSMILFKKIGLF